MGAIIAAVNKKGDDVTATVVAMLKTLRHKGVAAYGISTPNTLKIEKSVETLQNQNLASSIAVGHTFSKILAHDKPQPIKIEDAALVFEGRIYPSNEVSDVEVVARKIQQDPKEAFENLVNSEGCFVFAVVKSERIAVGRDALGAHPLYYGENVDFAALASERKALWKIGIKNVNSFPPGHIALVDKDGFKFKPVKTLAYSRAENVTMQIAAEKLQTFLQCSVKERVSGLKQVAVAFSGGLDSSLIAFLAKNSGVDVHLIHVSLENQPEIEHAKKVAEALELPIHVYLYSEEDVEKVLPKVLWLIEETDNVKASIGIPFCWTAEKTREMGFKVLLAGQGADELFGGYKRYVYDFLRGGSKKVRETIFDDIRRMYETNFERDFKICSFHNVELRLPFATWQIAKFATELPIELKLEKRENGLRKLVLRQVAQNLGLPQFTVEKPKKAMQYATGVNRILNRLAKKEGLPIREYIQKKFHSVFKKMMDHA